MTESEAAFLKSAIIKIQHKSKNFMLIITSLFRFIYYLHNAVVSKRTVLYKLDQIKHLNNMFDQSRILSHHHCILSNTYIYKILR